MELTGLSACGTAGCPWHVHTSAVAGYGDCSSDSTGGHYAPTGFETDVWALSAKLGNLPGAPPPSPPAAVTTTAAPGNPEPIARAQARRPCSYADQLTTCHYLDLTP